MLLSKDAYSKLLRRLPLCRRMSTATGPRRVPGSSSRVSMIMAVSMSMTMVMGVAMAVITVDDMGGHDAVNDSRQDSNSNHSGGETSHQ